jgi:metal-responsive CopG/Arc/MetJ family transcriptional regulator
MDKKIVSIYANQDGLGFLEKLIDQGHFKNRSEAIAVITKIHLTRAKYSNELKKATIYIEKTVERDLKKHYLSVSEGVRTALYDFMLHYDEYQAKFIK